MKAITSPIELFGEQVNFVAGLIRDNTMPPEYVSTTGILTDPKYHNLAEMIDDYDLGYEIVGGAILPVLKDYDEDSDLVIELDDDLDIKHLGDMVLFDDDMSEIDGLLSEMIENYDANKFKQLCTSTCNLIYQIEQYNFKYNLNRKVPEDIKAIADKYNSESKGTGIVETKLTTGNLTLEMDSYASELFIEIPTPYYDPHANEVDVYAQDFVNVSAVFKALSPYGDNTDAYSPKTYMRAAEELGLEAILGREENNNLPIQQNERRFYEALKRYIYKSLELYLSKENMMSETEIQNRIKNNNLPIHIKLVLESFVKAFVNVNWRHSSLVPTNEFDPEAETGDDDDDSDGTKESAETTLGGNYDLGEIDVNKTNLDSLSTKLNHYMVTIENLMKQNLTAYAWAELIVKLARWGERKPTHIVFTEEDSGTNCNVMLNITDFALEEDLSYLAQLDTMKYGDADYLPLSVIKSGIKDFYDGSDYCDILGIDYDNTISDSILGLRCRQDFITAKGNKGRNVYFDLLTIVDLYRNGKGSIFGITYEDGKFKVDEAVESRIHNPMSLSSIITLLSKPANFMEKIYTNEYFVKELSESKNFTVKDVLNYSLYYIFHKLTSSENLTEDLSNISKQDNPKEWAAMALSKCVLSYAFLPTDEKVTLEKALNNMNDLYNGFEEMNINDNTTGSSSDLSKTNLFSNVVKEYKALKRITISEDMDYFVIPADETTPAGYQGFLLDGSNDIVNKDSLVSPAQATAKFQLGRLVFEHDRNLNTSKLYIDAQLAKEIKDTYLGTFASDIVQDYVVVAKKMAAQKK